MRPPPRTVTSGEIITAEVLNQHVAEAAACAAEAMRQFGLLAEDAGEVLRATVGSFGYDTQGVSRVEAWRTAQAAPQAPEPLPVRRAINLKGIGHGER